MGGGFWASRGMRLAAAAWLGWTVATTAGAGTEVRRGAQPAWVQPQALPADIERQASGPNGVQYLLVDQQVRLDPGAPSSFRRSVMRAATPAGLENISHLSIDYDPSYESVVLHAINVVRDGKPQDRLPGIRIRTLQREQDLESRIYDGTLSADIVLEDVRVGDLVEYAYTVRGGNPVFGKDTAGAMEMQWSAPVGRLHRRISAPAGMPLYFQASLTPLQVRSTLANGWQEHVWTADNVAAMTREQNTPRWYDPYPKVRWSTFGGWDAVARWAAPLYTLREPGPGLRAEIARIAAAHPGAEDRLWAALQFTQAQIRYLGIETGAGSHAPRAPDEVLALRYGDCKDKVLLLAAMLRGLGIEAQPALVHSRRGATVADVLPSPLAFNHVVLRAHAGGRYYWLDPTELPQKGGLERIAQADFGRALLVDGASKALSDIPRAEASVQRRHVDLRLDASGGYHDKVLLDVTTTYEGAGAERMRETLRNGNPADLQRDYLNFYLRTYPQASVAAPLAWKDDEAGNRIVVDEHYRVGSLATRNQKKDPNVYLLVPDVGALLRRPEETVRSAPLAVRHPDDVRVTMTALLPEDRALQDETATVSNAAFEFTQASHYSQRKLELEYRFRSLRDHVPPEALATYAADLDRAYDEVGYTLGPVQPAPQVLPAFKRSDVTLLLQVALVIALAVALSTIAVDERMAPEPASDRRLLAVGAGVLATPWLLFCVSYAARVWQRQWGWDLAAAMVISAVLAAAWWLHWRTRWSNWAAARTADAEGLSAKSRLVLCTRLVTSRGAPRGASA